MAFTRSPPRAPPYLLLFPVLSCLSWSVLSSLCGFSASSAVHLSSQSATPNAASGQTTPSQPLFQKTPPPNTAQCQTIPLAVVVSLVLGFLVGTFTGWIRHRFNVPTFITTLASMAALRGGAYLLTNSFP